jgi:hypothetical protein
MRCILGVKVVLFKGTGELVNSGIGKMSKVQRPVPQIPISQFPYADVKLFENFSTLK